MLTGHNKVALPEGAVSHQHRSHGTATAIQTRFHHRPLPRRIIHRGELEQFRLKQQGLEKGMDAFPGHGGDVNKLRIAAPLVRHHVPACQFRLDPLGIGPFLIHLVHRHDDRHVRGAGMGHGLFRLRHDPVVCSDHEDDDIRELGTPSPHRREGGVSGRIEEGYGAVPRIDVIGPNVLRNAARFAAGHASFTDVVEKGGFAVVDVTHHGHHRCPGLALAFDLQGLEVLLLDGIGRDGLRPVAELFHQQDRRVLIEHLVDGRHHPHAHELLDGIARLNGHALGKLTHGDRLGHFDVPGNHFRRPLKALGLRHALRRRPALALR